MQDAKDYITANDSKRKRPAYEAADSEDDELLDDTPNTRRTRHDEEVARQLQEEFFREADDLTPENDNDDVQGEEYEEMEGPSAPDPKGKGKAVAPPRPPTTRPAVKYMVPDSDEEEEYFDAVEYAPPSKRQKKTADTRAKGSAKGKGKMPAVQSDSDDELPRKYQFCCYS